MRGLRKPFTISLIVLGHAVTYAQQGHIVDVLYPQGGQRGTRVTVTVQGSHLESIQDILFYQPGLRFIEARVIDSVMDHRSGQPRPVDPGTAAQLVLEVDDAAPLGEHQLRIRTYDNLSELMTFWVTPFPILAEQHPLEDREEPEQRNDAPEYAQRIPMNCTVSGFVGNYVSQDHDWYRVECKRGQRLSVEACAARLGLWHYGGMNDPSVQIYDAKLRRLATNDDNALHSQDPVVTLVIPETGTYYIHMRQQMDYENSLRHYLMHVGTFARPMVAFPLGGPAGQPLQVTLLGDATGPLKRTVRLPKSFGPFEESILDFYCDDQDTPAAASPNHMNVAPFNNVMESPGHGSPEDPQIVDAALPIALNGRIQSDGEIDWYRITAKAGERYRVRTYAMTLDSELDAKVYLRPAPGNSSQRSYEVDDSRWEPHDLVGHHYRWQVKQRLDPVFMFEPDTDGDWLVGVTDTRREFGPRHVYRVEFQPHMDSAFVHFPPYPSTPLIVRDRAVVYRGHSYTRPLAIQPGFGSHYDKPLHVVARGLPTGVRLRCDPFRQSDGTVPITLDADANAPLGAWTLNITVEPVAPADRDAFQGGFVQVTQATNRRGDYAMAFNRTRKVALAVVDGARFDLEIEQPKIPLVLDGELPLKVRVNRHEDFTGAVYCEVDWLPTGLNRQPPLIISPDENEGVYMLTARKETAPGTYSIAMTGRENERGNVRTGAGFHYVSSQPISLDVGAPYLRVTLLRTAIERGTTGTFHAEIEHLRPLSSKATLSLGRLPHGVEQITPLPTVEPGQTSIEIPVRVSKDCLLGQYENIYCEAVVVAEGQQIRQHSGNGLLRIDAQRQK